VGKAVVWHLVADPAQYGRGFREADRVNERFARNTKKHFQRGGDDAGQQFGLRFNKRLGHGFSASTRIAKLAAGGIAGAFAAVQIGGFLKGAIDEAREAAKVTRQTNAVIKATGGVAKVSARDVEQLANSESRKVGVDDEIIQAGANMLLTFKGVRNEVGRNNDIFNQASATILDMTAAMHQGEITQQGLEKATIQVGKALNDPIKGITALTRVGVTFTQGQKDQIKSLVESGRKMEAQKIILGELKSEFGGAAKAAADPWQRVVVAFKNVQEEIGGRLLPKINDLFTFLEKKLVPKLGGLKKAWEDNKDAILSLLQPFDDVNDKSQTADERAQSLADSLTTLTEGVGDAARFLNRLGGHLNDLQASLDVTAKAIHTKFVRPAVASFLGLVRNWLIGMHTILRAAASTAEALHLPWAKNLRKIERETRGALDDVQHRINQLHGKTVEVKARATVEITRSTRLYLRAAQVPGFHATGGPIRGPGTGTSDSVPAMLSTGEHVWTAAEVRKAGGHGAMEQMRRQVRGYAEGGAVRRDLGRWQGAVVTATGKIGDRFADRLGAALGSRLSKAIEKAVSGGSAVIKRFLLAADRLPYQWGAAGPSAYDCSGLVSAAYGLHTRKGGGHGQRYFTTATFPAGTGFRPGGGGLFQVGVRRPGPHGTGHMVGRYGGLGFEARSTRTGIFVGSSARSPSSVGTVWHLAGGGAVGQLARTPGVDVSGDAAALNLTFGKLFKGWRGGKVFDRGGYLMPGATLAVNRTGRPEPVGAGRITREDARMIAQELAKVIPTTVQVTDVQGALLRRKRAIGGASLGLS
jgi:hypothetical protein